MKNKILPPFTASSVWAGSARRWSRTLAEAGKEVIAIDKNEEKVREVRAYTDYAFVVDNLSETALKETGMQNCGTVTCASASMWT